jgi:hypothetical protein
MDEKTQNSLQEIIAYLIHDERKAWEAEGKPDSHIYNDIIRVDDWLAEMK